MRYIAGLLFMLAMVQLAGCGGSKAISRKTLVPGEREFRSNCGSCHSLPSPSELTDSAWVPVVKQHAGMLDLEQEKEQLIIQFLQQHNRDNP